MTTEAVTPHSLDAERSLLGAILVDNDRLFDVADLLTPADFFREAHRLIYTAMRELAEAGQPLDFVTVKERLAQKNQLEAVNGPAYLASLVDGMPRSANVAAYAAIVRDRAQRARLGAAARKILSTVDEPALEARELVDQAERLIFGIAQDDTRGDFVDPATLAAEGFKHVETLLNTKSGRTGVPTGFADLDALTRGLQPGSLVLIAARPSMGKSAFALNMAYHASTHGFPVGFFSLEMSRQELIIRLTASIGRIDGHRLQQGFVNQTDYTRISDALGGIAESGLYVDDTASMGIFELRGKARRIKAKHGLGLIVVDYLQLMQMGQAENRNLAVADVSRAMKLIARELHIPVVALSQLSRDTERRGEKKPMLSDLRDSGALEQDADLVLFIHRPEVYAPTHNNEGLAEIVIAKQRNGPTGTIQLRWDKHATRFDNWSDR